MLDSGTALESRPQIKADHVHTRDATRWPADLCSRTWPLERTRVGGECHALPKNVPSSFLLSRVHLGRRLCPARVATGLDCVTLTQTLSWARVRTWPPDCLWGLGGEGGGWGGSRGRLHVDSGVGAVWGLVAGLAQVLSENRTFHPPRAPEFVPPSSLGGGRWHEADAGL